MSVTDQTKRRGRGLPFRLAACAGAVLLVTTLGVTILGGGAIAESPRLGPAPFEVPDPGTRMTWEDMDSGKQVSGVIGRATGMIVRWRLNGETAESLGHFCSDCAISDIGPDGGFLADFYPLQVGKSITFSRTRGGRTWQDRLAVVGTDRIAVPAGTYDTFVVVRRSVSAEGDWRAERRMWYAPALAWPVRLETYDNRGHQSRWQLLRVR